MARLSAVTGTLCISFAAIFFRLADGSAGTIAFFRFLYAVPMVGLGWMLVRSRDRRTTKERLMAAASGAFLGLEIVLWHHSIEGIGAGIATLLANTQVLFIGLISWLVLRERPSRAALITVPVLLAGIALLGGVGSRDAYGDDPLSGIGFGIATAAGVAVFLLMLRHSNRERRGPAIGALLDALPVALLVAAIAGLFESDFVMRPEWPRHGWILLLALIPQTIGWALVAAALPRLPALDTSVLFAVQPVGAFIWAALIFSERLSPLQWIGAGIVLAGIVVVARSGAVDPGSGVRPESAGGPGST